MIIDNIAQSSGKNGITPHIGANGNWWIDDVDTGVKAQGADGNAGVTPHIDEATGNWFIGEVDTGVKAKGTDGKDGTDGVDGITPHIGANGNWFLDETDTGISASGKSATTIQPIALLATAWVDDTQTVVCSGASADATSQTVTVAADIASKKAYADAGVICAEVGTDELTFTADIAPSVDLVVYVAIEQAGGTVASGPSNDAYSTEEVVIGTWIDGKPIYRLSMVATSPSGTGEATIYPCTYLNIDAPISLYGYIQVTDHQKMPINTGLFVGTWFIQEGIRQQLASGSYCNKPVYITIEYTKTTDVATSAMPSATALMDAYEEGVNEA